MTRNSRLSPKVLQHLIVRASQLESSRVEGIDRASAAAIAEELGISGSAWAAALQEYDATGNLPTLSARPASGIARYLFLASVTFAIGTAWSLARARNVISNDSDWSLAIVLLLIAVVVGSRQNENGTKSVDIKGLAAWWGALPLGLAVGLGFGQDAPTAAFAFWVGSIFMVWLNTTIARRRRAKVIAAI